MSLLAVEHLSLTTAGQQILRDITFSVKQGEVIGLIGPNGSGKTTLFNVLSGFFPPTGGRILFHGNDITALSPAKRAQSGIGRVFQNFGIFREMTIEENMLVALEACRPKPWRRLALPRRQRQALGSLDEKVRFALSLIGLGERKKEKASSLSGGQMRLLEIARTFVSGKELFLLDEPTAGVSPKMTGEVATLIKSLREEGKTVLIIEHDLPFIARICDRVIVLDVGSIVIEGNPQEVQRNHKLQEIYFGVGIPA